MEQSAASLGTELLTDIEQIFHDKGYDKLSSKELIKALCEDDERPWDTYNRGNSISPRQVARILGQYDISSKTIRTFGSTAKGYELEQFQDAFSRYLHAQGDLAVTTSQTTLSNDSSVTFNEAVTVSETGKQIGNALTKFSKVLRPAKYFTHVIGIPSEIIDKTLALIK